MEKTMEKIVALAKLEVLYIPEVKFTADSQHMGLRPYRR